MRTKRFSNKKAINGNLKQFKKKMEVTLVVLLKENYTVT